MDDGRVFTIKGAKEGVAPKVGNRKSIFKSGDTLFRDGRPFTKETLKGKKDRHILFRDAEEDISRIKRENKQAIEDFKKKQAKKKTVEDFRDEGDFDPGGMASGGRIGLVGGGAAVKVWKKFVEKLFKEEMTKPTFRNLNPKNKEWAKRQVENYNKKLPGITKKYEEFKKTGKLPEDMHVDDIFQKEHGISNNEYFRGYDTKKLRKKEVDYDYYREILDDAENEFVHGDETLETLEGMVKEQKAYERHMYDQYKTGKLDPVAGEKTKARR